MNSDTEWSIREKLALSSYVLQRGSQHWSGGVSRLLRSLGEPNRPADWFNSKNCAQQYAALIETAETPRRKRSERSESSESQSGSNSPPTLSITDSIVRRLTQERIDEIRKQMRSERAKYKKLKATLQQVESGELDDKLDDMIAEIQRQKQEKIEEAMPDEPAVKDQVQESEVTKQPTADHEMKEANEEEEIVEPTKETPDDPSMEVQDTQKSEELPETTVKDMDTEDSEEKADVTPVATITAPAENPSEIFDDAVKEPDVEEEEVPPSTTNNDAPDESSIVKDPEDNEDPEPVDWSKEPIELSDEELPVKEETSVAPPEESIKEEVKTDASDEKLVDEPSAEEPVVSEVKLEEENIKKEEEQPDEIADVAPDAVVAATKTDPEATSASISSQKDEDQAETKITTEEATFSQPEVLQTPSEKSESIPEKDLKEVESLAEDECDSNLSTSVADESTYSEQGYAASMPSTPAYVDSFPSSPALSTSSDFDPESTSNFRAWKKSIMILWKQVASHRFASLFLQPVTDDIAPNYSTVVYRAMDLATLKKNLETGVVRTTSEFQRDLMLMFQNALMYNNREHDVYKMAEEMQKDVMDQVAQFLATQLMMETAQQSTPKGLRRSTLRKSALSEKVKVSESRSKRTAAIEGEAKFLKKKPHE